MLPGLGCADARVVGSHIFNFAGLVCFLCECLTHGKCLRKLAGSVYDEEEDILCMDL